jgi:16S rRNA (guanine966-N2)-methyltransferase
LARLGVTEGFRIHGAGVGTLLWKMKPAMSNPDAAFDVVFLDPPYEALQEYAATLGLLGGDSAGLLADGALVIVEHRRKEKLEALYGSLVRTRLLEQGDAALSFYATQESR